MRKLAKTLVVIIILLAIVAVAVAFLTAPMGKRYVNSHGEELIGRKVNIGDFRFNILTGNATLGNVTIYEKNGTDTFMEVDDLSLNFSLMKLITGDIHIDGIHIDDAKMNIVQRDTTYNYDDLMAYMSEGEPSEYSIGKLRMSGIEIHYKDMSFPSVPFAYTIHDMQVKADDFTTSGKNHIYVSADLGNGGEATVEYHGTLAVQNNIETKVELEDVNLADFSPLFIQMFGREIKGGELQMISDIRIVDGEMQGTNKIIIDDVEVEKVKGLAFKPEFRSLPLKTCLYFITDRDGKCELDIPVSGNRHNPKFSYKRTLMRAFGRALGKAILGKKKTEDTAEEE